MIRSTSYNSSSLSLDRAFIGSNENSAATSIQACFRGYLARRELNKIVQCTICLNPAPSLASRTIKTSCDHIFHVDCLSKWLNTGRNMSCPFCRNQKLLENQKINEFNQKLALYESIGPTGVQSLLSARLQALNTLLFSCAKSLFLFIIFSIHVSVNSSQLTASLNGLSIEPKDYFPSEKISPKLFEKAVIQSGYEIVQFLLLCFVYVYASKANSPTNWKSNVKLVGMATMLLWAATLYSSDNPLSFDELTLKAIPTLLKFISTIYISYSLH